MLHIILKIIIGIILFFAILYLVLNLLFLITSKEFRDANIEGWKASARERERKKRAKKPYWTDRQYKRYLRTGNRHHLVYDYDDEDDE